MHHAITCSRYWIPPRHQDVWPQRSTKQQEQRTWLLGLQITPEGPVFGQVARGSRALEIGPFGARYVATE